MNDKKHWLVIGFGALVTASLLSGCSSSGSTESPTQSPATATDTLVTPDQSVQTKVEDRPGGIEGELVVGTAIVKAIDKKNRVVTLKSPDGKETKVKCGPEVRNFAQIKIGDVVTTKFLETVELFVTGEEKPSAERTMEVGRAPLGSKPGFSAIDTVEVKASVVASITRLGSSRWKALRARSSKEKPDLKSNV